MKQFPETVKRLFDRQAVRYALFGIMLVALIASLEIPGSEIEKEISDNLLRKVLDQRNWVYATTGLDRYLAKEEDRGDGNSSGKSEEVKDAKSLPEAPIFGDATVVPVEKKIVLLKLLQIKSNAEHHLNVAVYLYIKNYILIRKAAILAVVAAAILAYITKNGWEKTNRYVLIAFFIISAHIAYFYSMPNVCEFQKNIASNVNLYTSNVNLENRVLTFILDDRNFADRRKAADFIGSIDAEMKELNVFSLSLDQTKLPAGDASLGNTGKQ
ncbi:MAG TPA: hypothetical protein PK573_04545 [Spirochaetota bacterium]|nr:hypothetical protein [Spirochaetota bacterium]HSA13893.1 hypothetical protein [Spirochaetota bacterium]